MADEGAASGLTCLLAGRGDPDRLRAGRRRQRARRLAARRHLTEQGRGEEAERLRRFGPNLDGSIARA